MKPKPLIRVTFETYFRKLLMCLSPIVLYFYSNAYAAEMGDGIYMRQSSLVVFCGLSVFIAVCTNLPNNFFYCASLLGKARDCLLVNVFFMYWLFFSNNGEEQEV